MHSRLLAVRLAWLATAVSIFAGCSGSAPATTNAFASALGTRVRHRAVPRGSISAAAWLPRTVATTRSHERSWFARPITQSVFIADAANGIVDIFDFDSGRQDAEIGGLSSPEGLATDAAANLYVADTLTQTIKIYATPYSGTPTVLNDSGYYPVGVHVDESGNVYVANICSGSGDSCHGDGDTVMYDSGSHTRQVFKGGPGRAYFVATDAAGNVWVDGQKSAADPTSEIGYFKALDKRFVPVAIAFAFPGGIAFDRAGNLLLDDQAGAPDGASILDIYAPGATSPTSSIELQDDGDDIIDIALGSAEALLFAPDSYAGDTTTITYPGGAMRNVLIPAVLGEPTAVAVTPATTP